MDDRDCSERVEGIIKLFYDKKVKAIQDKVFEEKSEFKFEAFPKGDGEPEELKERREKWRRDAITKVEGCYINLSVEWTTEKDDKYYSKMKIREKLAKYYTENEGKQSIDTLLKQEISAEDKQQGEIFCKLVLDIIAKVGELEKYMLYDKPEAKSFSEILEIFSKCRTYIYHAVDEEKDWEFYNDIVCDQKDKREHIKKLYGEFQSFAEYVSQRVKANEEFLSEFKNKLEILMNYLKPPELELEEETKCHRFRTLLCKSIGRYRAYKGSSKFVIEVYFKEFGQIARNLLNPTDGLLLGKNEKLSTEEKEKLHTFLSVMRKVRGRLCHAEAVDKQDGDLKELEKNLPEIKGLLLKITSDDPQKSPTLFFSPVEVPLREASSTPVAASEPISLVPAAY